MKERIGGKRFDDDDEVEEEADNRPKEHVPERLQKCIDRDGDYVEMTDYRWNFIKIANFLKPSRL